MMMMMMMIVIVVIVIVIVIVLIIVMIIIIITITITTKRRLVRGIPTGHAARSGELLTMPCMAFTPTPNTTASASKASSSPDDLLTLNLQEHKGCKPVSSA